MALTSTLILGPGVPPARPLARAARAGARLQLRRPAGLWLPLAAVSALAVLTALWFAADWLLDGLHEAREDVWEHLFWGVVWLAPALLWMTWRAPRSRLHALATTVAWVAAASILNLLLLYRSLAEDLGLPTQVSAVVVGSLSVAILLLQVLMALVPAAVLQALMYRAGPARRRVAAGAP